MIANKNCSKVLSQFFTTFEARLR